MTPAPLLIISPWVRGAPDSQAQARFMSSSRRSISSQSLVQIATRSSIDIFGHGPRSNAMRAAFTALSASIVEGSDTLATTSSVDGETTSKMPSVAGSTHSPPMKSLSSPGTFTSKTVVLLVIYCLLFTAAPCRALHRFACRYPLCRLIIGRAINNPRFVPSRGGPPGVDREDLAGDHPRVVTGQVDHHLGDVVNRHVPTSALEQVVGVEFLERRVRVLIGLTSDACDHSGVDRPRGDGVDVDLPFGELVGPALRGQDHRTLGGGIVRDVRQGFYPAGRRG